MGAAIMSLEDAPCWIDLRRLTKLWVCVCARLFLVAEEELVVAMI